MNFGEALQILKEGDRVRRAGWNGKGMFLILVPGHVFKVNRPRCSGFILKERGSRFYADHDSWMSPPSGSGEDPIPPRYLVAQYGEPEGAGGWFHAEKALAPELSQELLKGLDVLADPEGH